MIELPAILDIPDKLLPMITEFNNYRYCVAEGGRGSGKSHAVARFILYLCSIKKLRCLCLREVQNSIEESVYQLLVDIIQQYQLDFDLTKTQITHMRTGSTIRFKGCQDRGVEGLKSAEGVDIIWIEEAQSISHESLEVLIPTVRKEKARWFCTMNRYLRTDPVYERLVGRPDTLHIHINYYDNKFCPAVLKKEAAQCKADNPKEYNHIWEGEPLATTTEYLFNFDKLAKLPDIVPFGAMLKRQRCLSIDFSGGGGALCVASVLERRSNIHWELADQHVWQDPDTDSSVGKSIALYGQYQPDVFIVDAGGLGYPMFISISKVVPSVIGFDGSKNDKCGANAGNNRAQGYLDVKEFIDREWLICQSKVTIKEFESIKRKYKHNGKIYIQSKVEMDKSPDHADSVMMGVLGIKHYMGKITIAGRPEGQRIQRVNRVRRGR